MKPSVLVVAAVLGFSIASAQATPPTDEQVAAAIKSVDEAVKGIDRSDRAAYTKARTEAAAAALAGLDLSEATVGQIKRLASNGGLLSNVPSKLAEADKRLEAIAANHTVEGAEAAALRGQTVTATGGDRRKAMTSATLSALSHPAFGKALSEGKCVDVIAALGSIDPKALTSEAASALAAGVSGGLPAPAAGNLGYAYSSFVKEGCGASTDAVRTLREASLGAIKKAMATLEATPENERVLDRLSKASRYLDGPAAKGELVDHAAPELHFKWSSSKTPISNLADLHGKVVVIDFWATWCGPCVASFPTIRELQARYEGYPVVILGVTSIQGSHTARKPGENPERIDLKGNPAREMELMTEFMRQADMTWTVAFSDEDVFNPDYGVFGIPHAVIIDAKGVLRHRGIHPGGDPAHVAEKIDELLKAANLPFPDKPMGKREENRGG